MNLFFTISSSVSSMMFWMTFILGASIGSFLNVCILRIPEGTFWTHHRSFCPKCHALIPFYLNIPILAFFVLRGRAKCCGAKLLWQYPLIELLCAIIFSGLYIHFPFAGMSLGLGMFDLPEFVRWAHAGVFISLMLAMSVIDARMMIIPDALSLGMVATSPLIAWIHPDFDFISSISGVVLGAGVLYLIAWAYWLLRKNYGIGFGDVKLLAAIGGWLGWQAVFPTLFLGSMVGSIMALVVMIAKGSVTWQSKIPFGPFLAAGAVAHLLFGSQIFAWLAGG